MDKKASIKMNEVQTELALIFKERGFKKRNRTYNRLVEDELVHVVNFQLGQFPIGPNYIVPGLRENLYGKFAINLGVYIPKINEIETGVSQKAFINEYDCTIRQRLKGNLEDESSDKWWDLKKKTKNTIKLLESYWPLMDSFFSKFSNIEDIFVFYTKNNYLPFRNPHRSQIDISLIYLSQGKSDKALSLIQDVIDNTEYKGFKEYCTKLKAALREKI